MSRASCPMATIFFFDGDGDDIRLVRICSAHRSSRHRAQVNPSRLENILPPMSTTNPPPGASSTSGWVPAGTSPAVRTSRGSRSLSGPRPKSIAPGPVHDGPSAVPLEADIRAAQCRLRAHVWPGRGGLRHRALGARRACTGQSIRRPARRTPQHDHLLPATCRMPPPMANDPPHRLYARAARQVQRRDGLWFVGSQLPRRSGAVTISRRPQRPCAS